MMILMISISNDRILETVKQGYTYDQTQQQNEFREKRIEIEPNNTTQLTQRLTSQTSNRDDVTDSESDNDEFWKRVGLVMESSNQRQLDDEEWNLIVLQQTP